MKFGLQDVPDCKANQRKRWGAKPRVYGFYGFYLGIYDGRAAKPSAEH
ncbi:hypothetical protein Alches_15370 [Alicyclobacillus hesperidum subsp. aegles]|nr:hypothetical protein Alches_15370 [Alicyclobacillus hesperidum subsp. aegles]